MELKDVDFHILSELFKNSRNSDRNLAKKIGVSQPTVRRRRKELEKELMLRYTCIPKNLGNLNLELLAFNFVRWKPEKVDAPTNRESWMKRVMEFHRKHPNIILASKGDGLGFSRIAVSLHQNYSDYVKFLNDLQEEWSDYIENYGSFIVALKGEDPSVLFDFAHLAECINPDR